MGLKENIEKYGDPLGQDLKSEAMGRSPIAEEDEGSLGRILQTLAYLDRPRNALATGVQNILDEDPETGFLGGLGAGFWGREDTPWSEVFGWERGKPTDEWGPWLKKEGMSLGADSILDPLNLFFGVGGLTKPAVAASKLGMLGKATQGLRQATGVTWAGKHIQKKALRPFGEYARGSRIGKHFSMRGDDYLEELIMEARREGDVKPLMDVVDTTEKRLDEYFGGIPDDRRREIIENVPLAIEKGIFKPGVRAELIDIYRPIMRIQKDAELQRIGMLDELADMYGSKRSTGLLSPETLRGGEFLPHLVTGKGRFMGAKLGGLSYDASGMREKHRMMTTWLDDEGHPFAVSKRDKPPKDIHEVLDEATGKTTWWANPKLKGKEWTWKEGEPAPWMKGGIEVRPVMATIDELEQFGVLKGGWEKDPLKAYTRKALEARAATQYMRVLKGLEGAVDPETNMKRVMTGLLDEHIPKGYRRLKMKGFEDLVVKNVNANRLESLTSWSDPGAVTGILDRFIKETRLGQAMEAYTRWWKRNTLAPFPGFYVANAISDLSLAYMSGLTNPNTVRQGYLIRGLNGKPLHKAKQVIDGIPNHILRDEFRKRDLIDRGLINLLGEPSAKEALRQGNRVPFLEMATERYGKAGRVVKRAGEWWEARNNQAFMVGAWQEEGLKTALALDWLKKNVRSGKTPTAKELDQAALHAREALFDYGDLPALQDAVKRIGGVPFIAWYSNLMRKTLKDVVEQPHRLARLGRLYDFTFRPVNSSDREILPEWMAEQAPAQIPSWVPGVGGDLAMLGRFLPHGTVEPFGFRPGQAAFNMLGPLFKGPVEEIANYSMFKDRPIDELSTRGFVGGMVNPIAALAGGKAPYDVSSKVMFPGVRPPAAWEHAATTYLPISRLLTSFGTLGSGEIFEDPTRLPQTRGQKVGWVLTGGKAYEFDRQKALSRAWKDFQQQKGLLRSKMKYASKRADSTAFYHYRKILHELVRNPPVRAAQANRTPSLMGENAD